VSRDSHKVRERGRDSRMSIDVSLWRLAKQSISLARRTSTKVTLMNIDWNAIFSFRELEEWRKRKPEEKCWYFYKWLVGVVYI